MSERHRSELTEAIQLLRDVKTWSDEAIQQLPPLYRKKAREYQQLTNDGE